MQDLLQHVLAEVRSAWRFRWHAVVTSWTITIVGLATVAWLPDIYQASARVYVDGTSALRPLLNDRIVAPDVATHLAYVRQALLGKEYLEQMAAENGVISSSMSNSAQEKALQGLRTSIGIDAEPADTDRNNRDGVSSVFTITFRDKRPEVAVGVVRSLMNSLIEDTLGANRAGTDMAARFLDDRIAEHEARLEKAEQALATFQRANSGKLPGTEGTYFERMQHEREALEKTRRDLRLANSRRDRLREQLTSEKPVLLDDATARAEPPPNSIDARIRDQRAQLDKLLVQYTDRHPAVIALRESLKALEGQRAEQLKALGVNDTDQQISAVGANPVYQAVEIELNKTDVEIANLEADVRDREQKLRDLQAMIDEVPGVEAELARLNRDYNVIKEQYEALIQSREKQKLSQKASASDQVEFRLLNPPQVGPKPVAPARLKLLALVLVAALGAGAGLSYALAQLRPVFSSARMLRDVSGFPVIGSVSRVLMDPRLVWRRRLAFAAFSVAVLAMIFAIGGVAAYYMIGPGVHSVASGA